MICCCYSSCSSKICWWWATSIFGGQEILVAHGQPHHFWISETLMLNLFLWFWHSFRNAFQTKQQSHIYGLLIGKICISYSKGLRCMLSTKKLIAQWLIYDSVSRYRKIIRWKSMLIFRSSAHAPSVPHSNHQTWCYV
jgi:hypothetical protein